MNQAKIGKFILELRKEMKMTQQELANKLNVTDRAISHWENGRSIPDILLFKPICEIFNISINELISGEKISKDKLIKQSDENIINTLKDNINDKKKSKNIINILIISIIILLISVICVIKNRYPKIDLFNFTIQQSDPEKPFVLEKKLKIDNREIYYYGLDFAVFCEKNEKCYQVNDALKRKQITLSDFQKYLEKQVQYENFQKMQLYDGGTTIYSKGGMQVMFCNTIDGNKDVYIGDSSMVDNLQGKYCGHQKTETESYIKTYKVLSVAINNRDSEYNDVLLESINGKTGKVIVNNSFVLVPGHAYYFTFFTFNKFEDTIENIFSNSTLLKAKKVDGDKRNWINENIIVNKDLNTGSELNELEHVRMDIVEGTLTKTGAKIKITDFSGNKYTYGEPYRIDEFRNGEWNELEEYCPTKNCVWNAIAYGPDKNGHILLDLDWSYLYGELKSGRYRIVKDAFKNDEECLEKPCKKYYFSVIFDIK